MFKIKVKKSGLIARALQRAFSVGLSAALMLSLVPKSGMVSAEVPEPGRTLSGMEVNVMVASSWADNYDADFYDKISGEYATSYNTAGTALEIGTAAQLAAFAKYVNNGHDFANKHVRLTANIDTQGVAPKVTYINDGDSGFKVKIDGEVSNNWVPIGYSWSQAFNGTFDGGYHFISNMVLYNDIYNYNGYSYSDCGLFGCIKNSEIKNVGVKNAFILGTGTIGRIAGSATNSTIESCYGSGTMYSYGYSYTFVGGIIGKGSNSTIKNCYNNGDIFGSTGFGSASIQVGGISGDCGNMTNCYSSGRVYAYSPSSTNIGALSAWGTVENSYYNSDVAGNIGAVGGADDQANNAKGLTTAQMQGNSAKINMVCFTEDDWIFNEGEYPCLKGFFEEADEPEGTPGSENQGNEINVLTADVTVNGQPQRIMVRGSYRALPQGTRLLAQVVARHADFDQQGYDIEHEIHYQITLVDESGNPLPMPLPEDVELLLQVIPGLDKSDLEVVLAQSGIDTQFDENLVEIGGESYVLVKTNHFSPYSLIDKLTEEEKAELNKALENLSDKEKSALGAVKTGDDPSYVTILGLVMILALGLMLNSKIRPKKF